MHYNPNKQTNHLTNHLNTRHETDVSLERGKLLGSSTFYTGTI